MFQHLLVLRTPRGVRLILPAFGLVSHLLTIERAAVFAKLGMVQSMVAIGLVGFLVWGHHMFTVGMDVDVRAYFVAVTMVVAVPTGVKIFLDGYPMRSRSPSITPRHFWCLLFDNLRSRRPYRTCLANAGVDLLLHDTYYVVAHFHYVCP